MTPSHPGSAQEIWIANSSPFIGLAQAGLLPLLTAPGRDVYLPQTVVGEIAAGPSEDPAAQAVTPSSLAAAGIILLPTAAPDLRLASFPLDPGERDVLTEALARPGSLAVIDDRAARAAAIALGVRLLGSLGVLVTAKRTNRLPALAPAVRALKATGLFLPGDPFLRNLLASLGEAWP